jgi:hypothetical protein
MAVVALKQPALKPKGPSFAETLAQTAKVAEPKAKKSKMPTLQPDNPEVAQAVDDYQEAKIQYKMAEATMDNAGTILQEFVRQHQDEDGFRGHYQGSYAVMGIKHQAKVVYANKFTVNAEDKDNLKEILGENYDYLLSEKYSVKLKSTVFDDEALAAELMELVGDRWGDFFDTEVKLSVCENFSQVIYQAVEPDQLDNVRVFAKQYKPSIR